MVKDTSYSRTLVFTSVVLWVVVAAWGKSRKGGRAVCEVVVLLNLQHEVLESAQESVVVGRSHVCCKGTKWKECEHIRIRHAVNQMGDVGLMFAQPSSSKVAPTTLADQPVSEEADEARYRVTDQAVDALAVAWHAMLMHDIAIVCDHCT